MRQAAPGIVDPIWAGLKFASLLTWLMYRTRPEGERICYLGDVQLIETLGTLTTDLRSFFHPAGSRA
jgi:hypothetical protein